MTCFGMQIDCSFAADGADVGRVVVADYSLPSLSNLTPTRFNPMLLNWADLPFTLHLSQSGGYNDNILGQPASIGFIPGAAHNSNVYGDLFESTNFGLSTKLDIGPQEFFADANYGFTKYRQYSFFNTNNHFINVGVKFQITPRCTGSLTATSSQSESPLDELITPGINTVNQNSISETATCIVFNHISAILDSGFDSHTNSQALTALNNYRSVHVRGGLEYALSDLDSLTVTTQFIQRDFSDNQLTGIPGVSGTAATNTDQTNYNLSYQRTFSPKLTAAATGGITQTTTQGSGTSQSTPTYSANLTYNPTPKLSVSLGIGHTVGAPTSVLATSQLSDTKSLGISYAFSPKLAFQASVSQSNTTAQGSLSAAVAALPYTQSNTSTSEGGSATYQISPFLTATASIRHTARSYSSIEATTNLYTLGLSYNPH